MPKKSDFAKPTSMGGSAKAPRNGNKTRVEWKGYINVPLLEADKRHYHVWRAEGHNTSEVLTAVLEEGFKLSVDFQMREGAFRASLYCQSPERIEAGYSLSLFAGTPDEAITRLLYVHAVKTQWSWERWVDNPGYTDDWDEYS